MEEINKDLFEIHNNVNLLSYNLVRKFVVDYLMMDMADQIFYAAFLTKSDEIFYQNPESDDWNLLRENLINIEIADYDKY